MRLKQHVNVRTTEGHEVERVEEAQTRLKLVNAQLPCAAVLVERVEEAQT